MTYGLRVSDPASRVLLDVDTSPYSYLGAYYPTTPHPASQAHLDNECSGYGSPLWELDLPSHFATHYVLIPKSICPLCPLVFMELDTTIIAGLSAIGEYDANNWAAYVYQYGGTVKLQVYGKIAPAGNPAGYGLALYDSSGAPVLDNNSCRPPLILEMASAMNFRLFQLSNYRITDYLDTFYSPAVMPERVLLSAPGIWYEMHEVGAKYATNSGTAIKGFRREGSAIWARGGRLAYCQTYEPYINTGGYTVGFGSVTSTDWFVSFLLADGAGLQ